VSEGGIEMIVSIDSGVVGGESSDSYGGGSYDLITGRSMSDVEYITRGSKYRLIPGLFDR
jgi:hypothetical protein